MSQGCYFYLINIHISKEHATKDNIDVRRGASSTRPSSMWELSHENMWNM